MDARADEPSSYPPSALLTSLLRDVSRSFYWTLWILPTPVRRQIGLAYLLARTTDTIADTDVVPIAERLQALQALRQRILGENNQPLQFAPGLTNQASPAEKILLQRIEQMLDYLAQFPAADQELIREVLSIITSGQELDLQRFGSAKPGQILALRTDAELDDYTYRVAGCVGEFWTKMCRAHLFPKAPLDETRFLQNGIRFGKGLQLVNVLRDIPADLRKGRCYIPTETLASANLTPQDLLKPENEPRFRPLYNKYLATAHDHLTAGWEYTNTLPARCIRVRLACAWPILIGIKTLAKLRDENVLDGSRRIKISRAELKSILFRSTLSLLWPPAWKRQFYKH
jgi:farnesyl-diphosphate farnesyltransferase